MGCCLLGVVFLVLRVARYVCRCWVCGVCGVVLACTAARCAPVTAQWDAAECVDCIRLPAAGSLPLCQSRSAALFTGVTRFKKKIPFRFHRSARTLFFCIFWSEKTIDIKICSRSAAFLCFSRSCGVCLWRAESFFCFFTRLSTPAAEERRLCAVVRSSGKCGGPPTSHAVVHVGPHAPVCQPHTLGRR